jgi:hypothetical protein
MIFKIKIPVWFLVLFVFVSCKTKIDTNFAFEKTAQGVVLYENKKPVFVYQKEPKTTDGVTYFNNYLHPLFSLEGDTLTEEFPADHPYHRGVFWAWHQLYLNNQSIGDGWVMKSISQDVMDLKTKVNSDTAQLSLNVLWKSALFHHGEPFVREHTTIIVHPTKSGIRIIDFNIDLRALVPKVSIGGADDEKGYGGFCARIKLPDGLCFTSEKGKIIPETLQINSGSWMDFSAPLGKHNKINGLTLLCHPSTPNYPEPWILRQKSSMQNIVFPGRIRTELSLDKSTVLHYRMIIHNGDSKSLDIAGINTEYEKMGLTN